MVEKRGLGWGVCDSVKLVLDRAIRRHKKDFSEIDFFQGGGRREDT